MGAVSRLCVQQVNAITSAMHLNRVFTAEADEDSRANDANSANEPASKASIA